MATLYNIIYNEKHIFDSAPQNTLFYIHIPAYMNQVTKLTVEPQIAFYKEYIRIENNKPEIDTSLLPEYGTFLMHDVHKIKQIEPGTYFEIVIPGMIISDNIKLYESNIQVVTNVKQPEFLKSVVALNPGSVSNIVAPFTKQEPVTVPDITNAIIQYRTQVSQPKGLKSKAIDLMNRVYFLNKSIPEIMTIDDILLAQAKTEGTSEPNPIEPTVNKITHIIKLQAHYIILFHYLVFLKVNMTQDFYDSVTALCATDVPTYTSGMALTQYIKLLLQWASKCNEEKMESINPIKLPITKIQEVLDALHHTYVLLDFIHTKKRAKPSNRTKVKIGTSVTYPNKYPTQQTIKEIEQSFNNTIQPEIPSSNSNIPANPNDAFDSELEELYSQFTIFKDDLKTANQRLFDTKNTIKESLKDDKALMDSVYNLIHDVENILIPEEYKNPTLEDLAGEPLPFIGSIVDVSNDPDFSSISLFDVVKMPIKGGNPRNKKTRKSRTIYSARTTRKS
jgi:hypothetical protein